MERNMLHVYSLLWIIIYNFFFSLLCAITVYSTVFSTKMREGANQTEIATLLREDGYANTGLTFLW